LHLNELPVKPFFTILTATRQRKRNRNNISLSLPNSVHCST
jgi:hypothetical protein